MFLKRRKKKEVKEDLQLGGQWKVSRLVVLGMFHVWWPFEREGKTSFSPPSPFHPKRFYLNIVSIDFRVFFYHVLDHYFVFFLPFP
jgi:hypothetical protein